MNSGKTAWILKASAYLMPMIAGLILFYYACKTKNEKQVISQIFSSKLEAKDGFVTTCRINVCIMSEMRMDLPVLFNIGNYEAPYFCNVKTKTINH